jgi:hypothetical protein
MIESVFTFLVLAAFGAFAGGIIFVAVVMWMETWND